ncbi:MAG: sensor histidine kinase [Lachnospiraceae bacterium]
MENIKDMLKNNKVSSKITAVVVTLVGIVIVLLLVYLGLTNDIVKWKGRRGDEAVYVQDCTCREIESEDSPIGIIIEYTFTVSESLKRDTYLSFYTVHQYVSVYIDGEKVYCLEPSGEEAFIKTVGSNWNMIPLYREDAGKEIKIEISPAYESFKNRDVEFLIGSGLSIYVNRLIKDLPQMVVSFIAVLVGFVFLIIAIFTWVRTHHNDGLASLGLFSLMLGIWRLTDTRFTPFILEQKPILIYYISVIMLMLGMISFIKVMGNRFNKTGHMILNWYGIVASIMCLGQLLLQILGIKDIRESLIITHVVIAIGITLVIVILIVNRIKNRDERGFLTKDKLLLLCVMGALADVVAFYVRKSSSGLLFTITALLINIIFSGVSTILKYTAQEKELAEKDRLLAENEHRLAENEHQLTENRIATMISQIQPHFIYNTLGTIEQLCLEKPDVASELVHNFSLYLRGNFGEVDNSAPIPLSKEINHVKYYVAIEQVRFPDMTIKFQLNSGEFLLPALSIQPLVENAIKHGLMGLESGGTVVVSTYETDADYCVSVEDDGVGFNINTLSEGPKHIGIRNIRGRLEAMCGGTLTVISEPGKGTVATIKIPKEDGHDCNNSR